MASISACNTNVRTWADVCRWGAGAGSASSSVGGEGVADTGFAKIAAAAIVGTLVKKSPFLLVTIVLALVALAWAILRVADERVPAIEDLSRTTDTGSASVDPPAVRIQLEPLEVERTLVAGAPSEESSPAGVEPRADTDPLVVSGRFVFTPIDPGGRVEFAVEVLGEPRDGQPNWESLRESKQMQRPDGTFEVRGRSPAVRHRIQLPAYLHLPVPPIEFERGAEGLVIHLEAGNAVTADCVLPDGAEAPALLGVLVPSPASLADPRWPALSVGPFATRSGVSLQPAGRLRWWNLPPGSYRLEVRMAGAPAPLATILDVVLPQPHPPDPRLSGIDLRGSLRPVHLRVAGPTEHPGGGSRESVVFPMPQQEGDAWEGIPVASGEVTMVLPFGCVELLVTKDGFQQKLVPVTSGELHVELEPWPSVELTVVGIPPLPDGVRLLVLAVPARAAEPAIRRYRDKTRSGLLDRLLHPNPWAEVVDGRARLAVEDRSYRIHVLLSSSREEGPRGLDHVAADEFQGASATGPILVRVSPDEIRGVIERMEKPDRR